MNKLKMLSSMKKIVALAMMATIMLGIIMVNDYETVYAATTTEDHGFTIDENLFRVQWNETGKIWVTQTCASWHDDFDNGDTLGYARVYAGFATARYKIDDKYYQRILVKAEMVPQTVTGKSKGMSQYLTVNVSNGQYMYNTRIEPASNTGSTSYSTTGSLGGGLSLGVGKEDGKYSVNGGLDFTLGISSSTSYVEDSLVVITNKDDNGYASWEYDYVSSSVSRAQNAYLFGSSEQYGLFSWNMNEGSDNAYSYLTLNVEAIFGGGNVTTNERARKLFTDNYHLGSASKSITIYYK